MACIAHVLFDVQACMSMHHEYAQVHMCMSDSKWTQIIMGANGDTLGFLTCSFQAALQGNIGHQKRETVHSPA